MEAGRNGRQLAALVHLRRETDNNTEDIFKLAEKVLDDNMELTEQLTEMRDQAEPRIVQQAHDMEILRGQVHSRNLEIQRLRRQTPGLQEWQQIKSLEAQVHRQDEQIKNQKSVIEVFQANQEDETRVFSLETMQPGDLAYRSIGKRGIDTIDRLRGPAWENFARSDGGRVHPVGTFIRIGDEAHLRKFDGVWQWLRVT